MSKKQDKILKHGQRFFEYALKHWNNTTKPDMIHWENLVACKMYSDDLEVSLFSSEGERIYKLVEKELETRIKNHIKYLDSYDKKNPMVIE